MGPIKNTASQVSHEKMKGCYSGHFAHEDEPLPWELTDMGTCMRFSLSPMGPVCECVCLTGMLHFTTPSSAVLGCLSFLVITTEHFVLLSCISGKSIWMYGCHQDCPLGTSHDQLSQPGVRLLPARLSRCPDFTSSCTQNCEGPISYSLCSS